LFAADLLHVGVQFMQRCHLLVVEGCGELLLRDVLQLLLDPLGRVLPGPLGVVALGMGLPLVRVAVGLVLVGPLTPAALVGLEVEVPVHVTLERVLVLESFPTDLALEPLLVAMGAVGVTHQVLAVVEELAADGTGQLGRPVDPVRHILTRDSKVNAVKSVME